MPNLLPTLFIGLCALTLVLALLWFWQSLRDVLIHTGAIAPASDLVSAERAALLAEKTSVLLALKDLEAEHQSGKLSTADFEELNTQYRTRARSVLRELDALLAPHRGAAKALLQTAAGGGKTEAAAQSTAGNGKSKASASADATQTASGAAADGGGVSPALRVCSCGTGNDRDAVFCKKCGSRLAGAEA